MITNRIPQRKSRSFVSFFVGVVALFLLAIGSENASAKEDVAPSAAFAMATVNPAAKAPVQFTARPVSDATAWRWDFGDGSTSASPDAVHAFAGAGEYPVTLTVTTPRGSASFHQAVEVTERETLRILSAHPFEVTVSATDPRTGNTALGQVL